ncbi:malonate decarboxylase epsilon subunit [Thalassobacillus cyri]|uniref:Malonyl CoA-acyl carrier protein transacylase n=1 Tax=Thalassobacillus cyri TaxID=571932 RepID=A0A1H4AJ68_9BACI|nr:malonate decarboxylase subunit epsilon [Thalassobacillus cyri]SEA35831.1 malonate decarboxylase epsilon subunit [Thalassobacillus cyri]
MSVAYLFPGQGSQQVNMLHHLPDHPVVQKTLDEASETINESAILLDSESRLQSTVAVQLCLLIAGVSTARVLETLEVKPDMVAGHSVGAFGAAVIAGVMDFKDAVSVVKQRGEWMEQAYPKGYGMGVVAGLPLKQLEEILENHTTGEEDVYFANLNSPDQVTISGSVTAIKRVLASAKEGGARKTEMLNVSVPSHCPLLEPVSENLASTLNQISFHRPTIPYGGNRTARALRDPEAIKDDLAFSVSRSVKWHQATSLFYELGARLFIELPPGRVLTDLSCRAFPSARSISVSDSGLKTAQVLINRMQQTQ